MWRYLNINLDRKDDRNAFYLVVEMFWATFLSAATAFNAAYALRLHASDTEVSYLTSIPALLAVAISIPAGQILQRSSRKKAMIMSALSIHRAGYLLIALVPWLHFDNVSGGTMIVILLILFSAPAQFFNVGFMPLQAEVIAPERRAAVISMRNQIFHAARSVSVFLFGLWLDAVVFPLNYQLMFIVTFALSILSIVYLLKIEMPEKSEVAELPERAKLKDKLRFRKNLQTMIADLRGQPQFLRFSVNTLLMDVGLWAITPLFTIFYVNELNASDSWLGIFNSVNSVTNIIGFSFWGKLLKRWGERKSLRITALMRPIFPLAVALSKNLMVTMITSGVMGAAMAGLTLSHYSILLKATPPESRERYSALYTTIQNISVFFSPLLGVAVSNLVGIPTTLMIFAGVRFLGGLMWFFFPIEEESPAAAA
ncbi:MAG: MFS transporter [Anaerolineaceae bacterium]|nr:MFS transporter [Anaerolineaceae bacterium]